MTASHGHCFDTFVQPVHDTQLLPPGDRPKDSHAGRRGRWFRLLASATCSVGAGPRPRTRLFNSWPSRGRPATFQDADLSAAANSARSLAAPGLVSRFAFYTRSIREVEELGACGNQLEVRRVGAWRPSALPRAVRAQSKATGCGHLRQRNAMPPTAPPFRRAVPRSPAGRTPRQGCAPTQRRAARGWRG